MPEPEVVGWDLGGAAAAADELEREGVGRSSSNSCNQATEEEEEWGMEMGWGMSAVAAAVGRN